MSGLDPRILNVFQARGLEGAQLGEARQLQKRGEEIPRRFFDSDFLENRRKVVAASIAPELQKTLTQTMQVPFGEMYGYERAPRGSLLGSRFIEPIVKPDLPFGMSRIMPIVNGDPEATQYLYRKAAAAIKSSKYPYVEAEVAQILNDIKGLAPRMQLLIPLGLEAGPMHHRPFAVQAFKAAVLLESAATTPEIAAMSVRGQHWTRRGKTAGPRARDTEILRRIGEFTMSNIKNHQGRIFGLSGPQLAEGLNMYVEELGPAYRFRRPRGATGMPLIPGLIGPEGNPILENIKTIASKNLREMESYKARSSLGQEAAQLTPEQRAAAFRGLLRERMAPEDRAILERDVLGKKSFRDLSPVDQTRKLFRLLREPEFEKYADVIQEFEELVVVPEFDELAGAATRQKIRKPSMQRLTSEALGTNVLTEKEAVAEANEAIRRLRPIVGEGPRNMQMILALAGILSAGMMAAGMTGEEAA